jgi:hypothetical protein
MTAFANAVVAAVLVGVWTGWLWHHWVRRANANPGHRARFFGPPRSLGDLRGLVVVGAGAVVTVVLAAPPVWRALATGYPRDSLLTLPPVPRGGLILLTVGLVFALFWISAAKTAAMHRAARRLAVTPLLVLAADLFATLVLFAAARVASPQIYYSYYRLVIPGLPSQWVRAEWPGIGDLLALAGLAPDAGSAAHAAGVGLWGLMIMTGWLFVFGLPPSSRSLSSRQAGAGAALLSGVAHAL